MVDSPIAREQRVVTSEAPQSHISPGEVAQPYEMLGHSLDKLGEGLEAVAIPLAERAGTEAVSRDPNTGELTVSKLPIFGAAGFAYSRAMKVSALAQGEAEARRQDILISKEFPDDPEAYRAAANKYRDKLIQQYNAVSPEVGMALGRAVDNQTTYNYRWMWAKHQERITRNLDEGTNLAIRSAKEDLVSLLSDPDAMSTPEGPKRAHQLISTIEWNARERVHNPVLGKPQEEYDAIMKQTDTEIGGARVGAAVAKILGNPALGTDEDRLKMAMSSIEEGARKTDPSKPDEAATVRSMGRAAIDSFYTAQGKQIRLAKQQQELRDENFLNEVVLSTAPGAEHEVTEADIKTRQGIGPHARLQALAFLKRDNIPEPMARVSERNTVEAFRRMGLPEGDPQRITSLSQLSELYAPADGSQGGINRKDFDWLATQFHAGKTPDGENTSKEIEQLVKGSNLNRTSIMKDDPAGPQAEYAYRKYIQRRVQEYSKTPGKHIGDLFDPTKPDFVGKTETIQYFRKTMEEQLENVATKFGGRGAPPPGMTAPAEPPRRKPGESMTDFDKRTGIR